MELPSVHSFTTSSSHSTNPNKQNSDNAKIAQTMEYPSLHSFIRTPNYSTSSSQMISSCEVKINNPPVEKQKSLFQMNIGTNLKDNNVSPENLPNSKVEIFETITHIRPDEPGANKPLGYFEEKIVTIIIVTRNIDDEGLVSQETETTVVREEKYDPNKTQFDFDLDNL